MDSFTTGNNAARVRGSTTGPNTNTPPEFTAPTRVGRLGPYKSASNMPTRLPSLDRLDKRQGNHRDVQGSARPRAPERQVHAHRGFAYSSFTTVTQEQCHRRGHSSERRSYAPRTSTRQSRSTRKLSQLGERPFSSTQTNSTTIAAWQAKTPKQDRPPLTSAACVRVSHACATAHTFLFLYILIV